MSRFPTLLLLLLVTCCAGYKLGPASNPGYRSVAVLVFRNSTSQPQLEAQVTGAIVRQFQTDGNLQIEMPGNADVILTGDITGYERRELRSLPDQPGAPREYRLIIRAKIEAKDRVTGQVILKPTVVHGKADTFIGTDLQSAEQQALPLIANDLAKQVVTLLAERW